LTIIFALFFTVSCKGLQVINRKDSLGRIYEVNSFKNSDLFHQKMVYYVDDSSRISHIIYSRKKNGIMWKYREEFFTYTNGLLIRHSFYTVVKHRKVPTGYMFYSYSKNKISRITYHRYNSTSKTYYLRALDRYCYKKNSFNRHLIEFQKVPNESRVIQVAQFKAFYNEKGPFQLISWKLDKKTKKIVEKKTTSAEEVTNLVNMLERRFQASLIDR
jgi:hypothetical protein